MIIWRRGQMTHGSDDAGSSDTWAKWHTAEMKTGQSLVSGCVTENSNRFLSTTRCAVQSTRALTGYFSHELEHSTIGLVVSSPQVNDPLPVDVLLTETLDGSGHVVDQTEFAVTGRLDDVVDVVLGRRIRDCQSAPSLSGF